MIKVKYLFQPRGSTRQCAEGVNSVNYYKRTFLGIDSLIAIHNTTLLVINLKIAEDNNYYSKANKTHNYN